MSLVNIKMLVRFVQGWFSVFIKPAKKQIVIALYVANAIINGTSRWSQNVGERCMLTWEQLAEISANGVECGAHSHSHPQLDTLPLPVVQDEILQCKRLLEDHLDQNIFSFAYPY